MPGVLCCVGCWLVYSCRVFLVSAMREIYGTEEVPNRLPELSRFARDWWRAADEHLLPGEHGGRTVFVLDFWDECRYFGYTRGSVFGHLVTLLSEAGSFGFNPFVVAHAARVPYLVRCVTSGLDERQARELRNLLVSEAPAQLTRFNGTTVRAADCCLATEGSGGGGMPFHQAADMGLFTREN